ncbi:GYDIA family GHMP kinase [Moheibacter stercoris]|uniref:Mevalonate kinase n=1 Tax=Moheibacter stercoris TaxID=1628251 RepID=A0ABV2LU25_9FLAO
MIQEFRANGKLLIAGEYTVLDGGLAFAIPTKLGQFLKVSYENSEEKYLNWEARLSDMEVWFSAKFELPTLNVIEASNSILAEKLVEIFQAIEKLNSSFFENFHQSISCVTQLEFPKDWGLGSSSTLIYLLAKWAGVNEFELSNLTFKTSGYDIASAGNDAPILYQLINLKPKIESVDFSPSFLDQLYFLYLNQKQDTQLGVAQSYKSLPKNDCLIDEISDLVMKIYKAKSLEEFERNIDQHEELLSEFMNRPKVKDLYFSDYEGSVKSLGAWGGDFVLVTKRNDFQAYFESKGYSILLPFRDLIL